jgi:hypothetical protein
MRCVELYYIGVKLGFYHVGFTVPIPYSRLTLRLGYLERAGSPRLPVSEVKFQQGSTRYLYPELGEVLAEIVSKNQVAVLNI